MAHVELPPDTATGDLTGAGSVFANRSFVFLWSAQTLSQLASNMVLAALMATVRATTGSDTAVAVLILTFLVPAVLFSTLGGVLVAGELDRLVGSGASPHVGLRTASGIPGGYAPGEAWTT